METTLFEVKLLDGRTFRVFCRGKNQINRINNKLFSLREEIEKVEIITNGIHTITEFENIITNKL